MLVLVFGIFLRQNRVWLKGIYAPTKIHVKIIGKVQNPGIYEMIQGSQLKDLVDTAGGFTNNVDNSNLNLDTEVKDGQVIRIE